MSEIQPNQNQLAAEVELKDAFDMLKKEVQLSTNCHAIATIQSFNSEKQTITATLNYLKTFKTRNQVKGIYEYTTQSYPILVDCPVVFLRGGPVSLRFPIQSGDTCLILFNDRDISKWFKSGQVLGPETNRLHSFSDGIALVGISSMQNLLENFATDHAGFAWGDTKLQLSESKILISNSSTSLGSQLSSLLTSLDTLLTAMATATAVNISTSIAGPSATAKSQIDTIKTALGGLLE